MNSKRSTIRQDIVNIPNLLTLGRIILIPAVCYLLYQGTPEACFFAFCFFWVASVTDWLDGYIARRQNLVSLTGKFLDPLADKLLVIAVLVMLVGLDRLDSWIVIVLISRELTITGLRAMAASEGMVIAAGQGGKLKTAFQMIALIGLITHYTYHVDYGFFTATINFHRVGYWTLLLSLFFSLSSGWNYIRGFVEQIDDHKGSLT